MSLRPRDLLARRGDPLQLESLTGELGLDRPLPEPDVASPGLVLAGYTGRFVPARLPGTEQPGIGGRQRSKLDSGWLLS